MVETATSVVTDKVTYLQTATKTQVMTDFMTVTAVSTMVEPTTYVKTWVQTVTKDNVSLIGNYFFVSTLAHSLHTIDGNGHEHSDFYRD
jgi:hypothetical protein